MQLPASDFSVYATAPDGYLTYYNGKYVIMVGDKIIRSLTREQARKIAMTSPNLTVHGKVMFDL